MRNPGVDNIKRKPTDVGGVVNKQGEVRRGEVILGFGGKRSKKGREKLT